MSKPTVEQIDDGSKRVVALLRCAENGWRYKGLGWLDTTRLASAYRSEHARAELLERQYKESIEWQPKANADNAKDWLDMLASHAREREALE